MIQPEGQTREMHDPLHLLRVTLESIRDAVVVIGADGRVLMLNRAAESLTGWSEPEAIGGPIEAIVNLRENGSDEPRLNPAYIALREKKMVQSPEPSLLLTKSGSRISIEISARPMDDPAGNASACVLVFHDVNEALLLAERRSYLAQYDPLTGLPNRILLVDRMEQATKFADRHSDQMAVISADLDRFSEINTAYGTVLGDRLLKEAAFRMTETLRESDSVSRLSADDFVILLPGVKSREDVESLAAKLLASLAKPFVLGQHSIQISCSVGISLYPQDAVDADTLIRMSDGALYQAKLAGGNQYLFARSESEPVAPDLRFDIAE